MLHSWLTSKDHRKQALAKKFSYCSMAWKRAVAAEASTTCSSRLNRKAQVSCKRRHARPKRRVSGKQRHSQNTNVGGLNVEGRGAHYLLDMFVGMLVDTLSEQDVSDAKAFLASCVGEEYQKTISTSCSGSDNFMDAWEAIERKLGVPDCKSIVHTWSCELCEQKRRWLTVTRKDLKTCFATVAALWHEGAVNCFGPYKGALAPVTTAWMHASGFVCKDISSLSTTSSANRSCVAKGTARTGSSWKSIMEHVAKFFPLNLFFEQVRMLLAVDKANIMQYVYPMAPRIPPCHKPQPKIDS